MTKLFELNKRTNTKESNKSDSLSPRPKTKFAFPSSDEERIGNYLRDIANISLSAMSPVHTPICITLDLSGSMNSYFESIKFLFTDMTKELMSVGRSQRQYTLIIMIINNGVPSLGYIGNLRDFDCAEFVKGLPKPYGKTPLAKSFNMADNILDRLYNVLETNRHWYTVPVFFSITDTEENGSKDDCTAAVKKYTEDIKENKKLFIEFVTKKNPNGLKLGGYRVFIDGNSSTETIKSFVDALRTATSTNVKLDDTSSKSNKPAKADRDAFNAYYTDTMLFNFKMCFSRVSEEDSKS